MSSWVLNITKDGDSSASLCSLSQCSSTRDLLSGTAPATIGFGCFLAINLRGLSIKSGFEARTAISLPVEEELGVGNL